MSGHPLPALEALCRIASASGAHVELHVTGPHTTEPTRRRLDRLRVAKDHHTLAHASIRPRGGRVDIEKAAMLCLEELAKTGDTEGSA